MTSRQQDLVRRDCSELLDERHAELEPLRGTRILITGGTGFLGTWLAEFIAHLNDNHAFGTEMLLLSSKASTFAERAPHLASRSDVTLMECDVRFLVDIPQDVAWIVHAASSPDSRLHASDPLRIIDVIVNGTSNLLATASRVPALRSILHVSSGLIYGAQPGDLSGTPEDFAGPLAPNNLSAAYAEAKRCAETVCAAYRNQQRLPILTARPFAFVGPYQLLDKPWAINNFLRDAILGSPIRILGDPGTVRSYLYASDMAFWTLKMLTHGKSGQCFNLGSPDGVTLGELAGKIAAQCPGKRDVSIPNVSRNAAPPARFVPDTTRAQTQLGLRATVNLDEAIRRTLAWNQAEKK